MCVQRKSLEDAPESGRSVVGACQESRDSREGVALIAEAEISKRLPQTIGVSNVPANEARQPSPDAWLSSVGRLSLACDLTGQLLFR